MKCRLKKLVSLVAIERNWQSLSGIATIEHPVSVAGLKVLIDLLKAAHEAAGPHDIKPIVPKARHPQQEKSPTLHNESSEKTPISQVILGAVTDLTRR